MNYISFILIIFFKKKVVPMAIGIFLSAMDQTIVAACV